MISLKAVEYSFIVALTVSWSHHWVPTASWCQGSRFGTGKQKAANFVVVL